MEHAITLGDVSKVYLIGLRIVIVISILFYFLAHYDRGMIR